MNSIIYISRAKVLFKGQYAYGNSNNGPWAAITLKVEWTYQHTDTEGNIRDGRMNAVIKFTGENAVWVRDNITPGNPFANIPDVYLDLWLRLYGDIETQTRKDGNGTWENVSNTLLAEYFKISEPETK